MAEVRLFPGTLRLTAFTPYKALQESEDGNWVIAGQELGVDSPEVVAKWLAEIEPGGLAEAVVGQGYRGNSDGG
ncbi:uncharacterized protein FFB14_13437 [Fusarium fujikuroi]|nr:uncharacterized protein FFB14_13437 [Fusarium fujikuroi]